MDEKYSKEEDHEEGQARFFWGLPRLLFLAHHFSLLKRMCAVLIDTVRSGDGRQQTPLHVVLVAR